MIRSSISIWKPKKTISVQEGHLNISHEISHAEKPTALYSGGVVGGVMISAGRRADKGQPIYRFLPYQS